MKKYTLYYATAGTVFLMVCGLIFASCDTFNEGFLERPARGAVSEEVLIEKGAEGADVLLMAAYDALTGVDEAGNSLGGGSAWESAQDNWIYGSVAGGEAYKGSIGGDQAAVLTIAKMEHDPSVGFFNSLWETYYEGISRVNNTLDILRKIEDISPQDTSRIAGEARFLRGHFYFNLKRNFGNVPWVDEFAEEYKVPNDQDVWPMIEADFQFAMDNLPETQSDVGRANSWAAAAYLAKAYLYQEKWQEARDLFTEVINQGMTSGGDMYALTTAYQDMFNPATENNSGSVFAVQNTGNDGSGGIGNSRGGSVLNYPHGSASPFGCCGFYQPSQWLVNSFRVDGDGHPILDRASGTDVKHDYDIDPDESFALGTQTLDPRLEWTVGRRGVPYLDWGPHPGALWVRDQAVGGPYAPKKHLFRQGQRDAFGASNAWGGTGSAVNYEVIRFADVLLMAAEAEAQLGNLEQARQYVNRIRNRAANPQSEVTNDMNEAFALAVVGSEADMLATSPNTYDWVVRTDLNSTFVYLGGEDVDGDDDPTNDIENWNEYELPDYDVSPYPASEFNASQQAALDRIYFERMLELSMEGHRFYDLVRWDIADNQLGDYYTFETDRFKENLAGGDFSPEKNEVYPIPQRQIDLSTVEGESVLQQNPGY